MASIKHSMFRDMHAMDLANPQAVTSHVTGKNKPKNNSSPKADHDWLT